MATRSGVLARGLASGGSASVVATCDPNSTLIVKEMEFVNVSGLDVALLSVFMQDAGATAFGNLVRQALANGARLTWSGWAALGPGDQLVVNPSTGGANTYFWVSGARLPGHL